MKNIKLQKKLQQKNNFEISNNFEIKNNFEISNNFEIIFENNGVKTDIKLNDTEFQVLNLAVNHNHGIINLLGHKEEIKNLFNMGFLTIENELLVVKKEFLGIFKNFKELDNEDYCCANCVDGINLVQFRRNE